jgi:Zn finger protein HypA/HybF involved in hydrogenase expression
MDSLYSSSQTLIGGDKMKIIPIIPDIPCPECNAPLITGWNNYGTWEKCPQCGHFYTDNPWEIGPDVVSP